MQLMKFHGSYQQDDRDRRTGGKGKFYQFMMRTRQPAGHVSNALYLVMDDLANLVGLLHAAAQPTSPTSYLCSCSKEHALLSQGMVRTDSPYGSHTHVEGFPHWVRVLHGEGSWAARVTGRL